MNVLLVDDEPLELLQLEYLITPHFPNWNLLKAEDASIAIELAKETKFFLAFLDIQMPGKNGLKLAEGLKQLYDIEIIMVTAYQSFHYAQKAIRIGVKDFLTKPLIEDEFIKILNKFKKHNTNCETIQQALNIIHENYAQNISLNYVAEKVFLNSSYLSRKFQEEIGMKFNEYLNSFRLETALKLIESNKNYNISLIAEKCGFNSQHYFSTMFRKRFGVSPSEYLSKY